MHQRLVNIRRQLVALGAKEGSHKAELKPIQEELRKIDSLSNFPFIRLLSIFVDMYLQQIYFFILPRIRRTRVDGKFLGPGGIVPASQAICSSLLEECFDIKEEIKAQDDSKNVGSSLKPIFDRLSDIRSELENLVLTHRWSLRETDLWNYSLSLQEIDKMRVGGKFVDSDGNKPPGQYVRTCWK